MTRPSYLSDSSINNFIDLALAEDLGEGDHSSLGSIPPTLGIKAHLMVKQPCILAGLEISERIFKRIDPTLEIEFFKMEGEAAAPGDVPFIVKGNAQSILSSERLVLNCLQRMCGIATYTRQLNDLIKNTKAQLMDTRKTTPNFRLMEKWAVHIGGGLNHRFALYDMVMLKDNHIDCVGGITNAVQAVRSYLKTINRVELKIEVETRTIEEVKEALDLHVDVIMLDNMLLEQIITAVTLVAGKCKLEASGGVTESTLQVIAETGVDFISVGALTHSVKGIDLSLKVVKE